MPQVIERIISFFDAGGPRETNRARLVAVRQVNSHWEYAARSLLTHRQITLTRVRQLKHLTRIVDRVPSIRSQIVHLSVPEDLMVDALQTRSDLGSWILLGRGEQDHTEVRRRVATTLLDLIPKLTSLESLRMHSEYTLPLFSSPHDIIAASHLDALITVPQLHITGIPGIQSAAGVGANPSRRSSSGDIPSPTPKYEATQLVEKDGASLSWSDSEKQTPCSSLPLRTSCIRSLFLVNASPIFTSTHLHSFLSSVSETLETLTISSSNPGELDSITQGLTGTLPRMSCLTHLSTNAYQLRVLSPALHTLRISLSANPSFCSTPTSTPTSTLTSLPIGTIFDTISGILDSLSSCTTPPPSISSSLPISKPALKNFTIVDASMDDFLHFNLFASDDWDASAAARQHRLWMTASQLGVLIEVKRRQ